MDRGADIAYLSAFPNEKECLFPALTYLRPTGNTHKMKFSGLRVEQLDGVDLPAKKQQRTMEVTVVEVEARF